MKIIKTARYFHAINEAAVAGNAIIVKKIKASDYEDTRFCIFQDVHSREIKMITTPSEGEQLLAAGTHRQLIEWDNYYPFGQRSAIAAYVLPEFLEIGEEVELEDYIYPEYTSEKTAKKAIFNGDDFELIHL